MQGLPANGSKGGFTELEPRFFGLASLPSEALLRAFGSHLVRKHHAEL